jgi:lon-related putative ATP-dependent protease
MIEPLSPDLLTRRCDPASLPFASSAEVEPLEDVVGQERAAEAVDFALGIERQDFHLFVMGPPGSGRHTLVERATRQRAAGWPRASDWVYVHNFVQPHKPVALELPSGQGTALRKDMQQLVEELSATVPAMFESEEYASRVEAIDAEYRERHERAFTALGEEALQQGVALLRTPSGFSFAPARNNEVLSAEDFNALPPEERQRIESSILGLQSKLEKIIREAMRWRKERAERIKALTREMTMLAVGSAMGELKARYAQLPKVLEHLEAVERDVLDNADDFRKPPEVPLAAFFQQQPALRRYEANLLVDHSGPDGAPVVVLDHPTHANLVGRADHVAHFGTLMTDFSLIKPGGLHRANGGVLMIDALKMLQQPFVWDTLKRALLRREIRIESLGEMYSLVSAVSLEPDPIPLAVKVVLFGDRYLYYLMQAYDPEFGRLFRVVADFADSVDRSAEGVARYARLIATLARRENMLTLDRGAVARAIDYAAREAGDSQKLSARIARVSQLLGEADHLARAAKRPMIGAEDVEAAVRAQRRRVERAHKDLQEAILRNHMLIDTAGAKVGQVNGLAVFELGDHAFAEPTRITATTRLGEGHVVDIQREVELGGAIHSKGVMILASFLASRFSRNRPHSLAASLVFEQTYSRVEGDSASLGELCALLSSLSGIPIRQAIAVTGSVNQLGEVQPIGAVNEKIEGFFDICDARGLTGEQAVIIPAANLEHLMLDERVIAAVRAKRFAIYAVRNVDEAIELLTGVPAEPSDPLARTPSVNREVARRLDELWTLRATLVRREGEARPRRRRRRDGD